MFKHFTVAEDVLSAQQVKQSVARGLRASLIEQVSATIKVVLFV